MSETPDQMRSMGPAVLEMIARRFQALSDPTRLGILHELMESEATVTDLVERTGLGQANVSKHLQLLHRHRFVKRRKEGLFAWYSVADPSVFQLCELMCQEIEADVQQAQAALGVEVEGA